MVYIIDRSDFIALLQLEPFDIGELYEVSRVLPYSELEALAFPGRRSSVFDDCTPRRVTDSGLRRARHPTTPFPGSTVFR